MVNNELKRIYSMTDSDLIAFSQSVCASMTRDEAEFTLYGVTPANITAFEALIDAFESYPTDEYLLLQLKTSTDNKNLYYSETLSNIRVNATRVDIVFGKKSPEANLFALSDIQRLSDNAYLTKNKMISKFLTENLTKLAVAGLTQVMIDDYDDLITSLEDAMEAQENANKVRANSTIERIEQGNEIFNLLSKYCEIGKRIWENVNPAHYNDYVIYGTYSPIILTPPTNFAWDNNQNTLSWDEVINATSYQVEMSTDNINWTEIYADAPTMCSYVPPTSGFFYFRCRARNSGGYGDFCHPIEIEYYTTLPVPQNLTVVATGPTGTDLEISWDAVPTANFYGLYRAIVNIGSPASGWIFQGNQNSTLVTQSVTAGHRYYYKVYAANAIQRSDESAAIYVDII